MALNQTQYAKALARQQRMKVHMATAPTGKAKAGLTARDKARTTAAMSRSANKPIKAPRVPTYAVKTATRNTRKGYRPAQRPKTLGRSSLYNR